MLVIPEIEDMKEISTTLESFIVIESPPLRKQMALGANILCFLW